MHSFEDVFLKTEGFLNGRLFRRLFIDLEKKNAPVTGFLKKNSEEIVMLYSERSA